jgi:hypothetical protein
MVNMMEYLMQNNKYVIALTVLSLGLKLAWPYLDIPPNILEMLLPIRTVFNWAMGIAFFNFMAFFIIAMFYKPQVTNGKVVDLIKKWVPIVMFTLPFILYGGVVYMAANNSWVEIGIFGMLVVFNQILLKGIMRKRGM